MKNKTTKTVGKLVLISALLLLAACGKQGDTASVNNEPNAPTSSIALPGGDVSVVQAEAGIDTGARVDTTLSYQGAGL